METPSHTSLDFSDVWEDTEVAWNVLPRGVGSYTCEKLE